MPQKNHHQSRTMRKKFALRGFVLAGALLVAACGGGAEVSQQTRQSAPTPIAAPMIEMMPIDLTAYPQNPPRRANGVVVGLLLPMGDARDNIRALAGDLYNAAQLALFDGGNGAIILKLHDTKGTPAGAQNAAMAAVAGGADIIIGPLFSSSVTAVAPVLAGRDIPALALSNDSGAARSHVWLMGFLPEQNITQIIAEAISQGLTRFGALLPQGPYGQRIGESFVAEVARFGGTVVQVETYPPEAKQMFEPVQRLAQFDRRTAAHQAEMARLTQAARALAPADMAEDSEADALFRAISDRAPELASAYEALKLTETLGDIPYDAVFLPEGGLALRNLAPLLPYYDIDPRRVKFIGTGLWDDVSLRQEPPLHGGWYAAPMRANWVGFAQRYERIYRRPPPRLAAMSYDAVALAVKLAGIHADTPFDATYLTDANGFAGIDGIVRLKAGGLNERGLAVQEMTASEPQAVRQAPNSFVAFDRHMRAALALAGRLKQENPDRQLGGYDGLDALFAPVDDTLEDMPSDAQTAAVSPVAPAANLSGAANPSRAADQLEAIAAPSTDSSQQNTQ